MEFTGERYIPSQQGQIKYEHLHRYAMSLRFVAGKSVLDIASGEGYGAALLASKAQSVTGVDVDPQSIQHAQNSYYDSNLKFLVGSCESIPLPDASFDVATSFETIEHHDKHEEMLREIKRVLKLDGLLIISSPNRLTYSDEPQYVNPFHVKELYFDEFRALLQRHFKHVEIFGQRLATGSFITPLIASTQRHFDALTGGTDAVVEKAPVLPSPIYFVALCSDDPSKLPQDPASIYLDPANDLLRQFESERVGAIRTLQDEVQRAQSELQRHSNEFALATTRFRALQRQYEATQHEHRQAIADMARQLEHTKAWLSEARSQVAAHAAALEINHVKPSVNEARPRFGKKRPPEPARFEGVLDYPKSEVPVTDRVEIYGWIYSNETSVTTVQAFLNDIYLGVVRYGCDRPDVAAAFPEAPLQCGYKELLWINHLGLTGPAFLRVVVTARNGERCIYTRSITIEPSASSPLPEDLAGSEKRAVTDRTYSTPTVSVSKTLEQFGAIIAEYKASAQRDPSILDWDTGLNLISAFPTIAICTPLDGRGAALPHLDHSIDLVVTPPGTPERIAEARRVASAAIVRMENDGSFKLEWVLPPHSNGLAPAVSIIIPAFNNSSYTDNCLKQLTKTLPHDFKGEIIIVDDASTDDTPDLLARWVNLDPRIKVLRNPENAGFIRSCNRGAEAAQSEIIVFLNNDTIPQPGWLPPLLQVFRNRPDAGAVGGKLIYPDGTLQEAGGLIFSDGSGCNFGRYSKSADAPLFNFVREVDYCSGALLATRRNLFIESGGFDLLFEPAYYEDADYCFALRSKGRRIYYQPESVVVHFEGASCGTDLNAGVKTYQALNKSKFVHKWRDSLRKQPPPPEQFDFATLQLLSNWTPGQ